MKLPIKIALYSIVGIIGLQLIPIEENRQSKTPKTDFIVNELPPLAIGNLLKNSCYDCHSNQTKYPDYAKYAPISWSIASHISEGKAYLNFSEWQNYNSEQKTHIIESAKKVIVNRKMPLPSYLNQHSEAKISDEQIKELIAYFTTIEVALKPKK